jgi:hypothetical protein
LGSRNGKIRTSVFLVGLLMVLSFSVVTGALPAGAKSGSSLSPDLPGPPSQAGAVSFDGQGEVFWLPPSDSSGITDYQITADPSGVVEDAGPSDHNIFFNLTDGTALHLRGLGC